jgi:hypothetical protein
MVLLKLIDDAFDLRIAHTYDAVLERFQAAAFVRCPKTLCEVRLDVM